jgi:hypothetical protein
MKENMGVIEVNFEIFEFFAYTQTIEASRKCQSLALYGLRKMPIS